MSCVPINADWQAGSLPRGQQRISSAQKLHATFCIITESHLSSGSRARTGEPQTVCGKAGPENAGPLKTRKLDAAQSGASSCNALSQPSVC